MIMLAEQNPDPFNDGWRPVRTNGNPKKTGTYACTIDQDCRAVAVLMYVKALNSWFTAEGNVKVNIEIVAWSEKLDVKGIYLGV